MKAFIFLKIRQVISLNLAFVLFIFLSIKSLAQLPDNTSKLIYMVSGAYIFNYNPAMPVISGLNPKMNHISLPPGAKSCLAVAKNLNAYSEGLTFYTIVGDTYYYHNGQTWISTGHHAGDQSAANIGSGGDYIYNLMVNGGQIFKYDGKSHEQRLGNVDFAPGGPVDVIGDHEGNFYVLKTSSPQAMNVYNSDALLVQSYLLTGMPNVNNGGGFAIIDQKVFVLNTTGFYTGTISGNTIEFVSSENPLPLLSIQDFGSAPFSTILLLASSNLKE